MARVAPFDTAFVVAGLALDVLAQCARAHPSQTAETPFPTSVGDAAWNAPQLHPCYPVAWHLCLSAGAAPFVPCLLFSFPCNPSSGMFPMVCKHNHRSQLRTRVEPDANATPRRGVDPHRDAATHSHRAADHRFGCRAEPVWDQREDDASWPRYWGTGDCAGCAKNT